MLMIDLVQRKLLKICQNGYIVFVRTEVLNLILADKAKFSAISTCLSELDFFKKQNYKYDGR